MTLLQTGARSILLGPLLAFSLVSCQSSTDTETQADVSACLGLCYWVRVTADQETETEGETYDRTNNERGEPTEGVAGDNDAGGIQQRVLGGGHPGEEGAKANLDRFRDEAFVSYSSTRNRPDLRGTSRLSPHLHYGEVSPRQVWHAAQSLQARKGFETDVDQTVEELKELTCQIACVISEQPT